MAIDKLIPQYLNSDTDQKLVKSVEMTDNLNVRTSTDEENSGGVLKNVKGTNLIEAKTPVHELPEGENRVIGSVSNEKAKEVIFFVWNQNGNHGIYKLETDIDKYVKVYEDSVLNFQKYSHVDCDYVINEDEETIVYWTDNINPPMKLNINRVFSGGYPLTLTNGTDYEKLLNLTVAKQPPLSAPTFSFVNNSGLTYNNISEKIFQFAYKYVYEDGEHSALSPYSSIAFAENMMKDYFITEGKKQFFNQIDVYVKNTNADAKEIILYARESTSQTFYEVSKIENTNGTGAVTIPFTNNKLGKPLSKEEILKSYDNVPHQARTLSISNNRLFFGNYTEGYPNVSTDIDIETNYYPKPDSYDIAINVRTPDPTSIGDAYAPVIEVDVTNLPSTVEAGSVLNLNFIINLGTLHIAGTAAFANIPLNDGELQITYETRNDLRDVSVNLINVKEIAGGTFFEQTLQLFLDTNFPNLFPSGFIPALTFESEGIYIRETLPIDSNTSKSDILDLISTTLTSKTFDAFLNPAKGARRLCVTKHGTNLVAERASFAGTSTFKFGEIVSNATANSIELRLMLQHIDIGVYEFFKDNTKPTNVIETNRLRLSSFETTPPRIYPITTDTEIIEGASGVYKNLNGYRSFKSASSHKLGIVYLDDRGRSSGVQEAGDVFVKPLNSRNTEKDGASSIVMRINHNAPSWAKRWLPVYIGSGNTELKFMYSVLGAFVPRNNSGNSTALENKTRIYISVNSIFGEKGFNSSLAGNIQYKFEEGDKLRIVDYSRGSKYTGEFKVIGFKRLNKDESENPILDKVNEDAVSVTTGDFLIVEDNGIYPFNYSSIVNENSKWFDNCIVEVYRNKKELEPEDYVYYELGKVYDVESGNHFGERNATTTSGTISYVDGVLTYSSLDKVFKGDVLSTGNSSITIQNVWFEDGYYYADFIDRNLNPLTVGSYIFDILNAEPVIEITQGDVYFRPRLLFTANRQIDQLTYRSAGSMPAIVDWIEDYSVSDFFKSKQTSKGKPYAYIPDSKTIRRISSITYSDPYVIDSDRLNLSTFNLSGANWTDLDIEYGQIDKIVPRGDSLTVLQNSKASAVPVGRNLVQYADGKQSLTTSTNVLGKPSYYAGDFGTSGNPESVIERFGVVYYADLDSRKVIRLSADGITPISDKGISGEVQTLFEDLSNNVPVPKLVGGFDPDNDEYILTVEDLSQSFVYVSSGDPELEPFAYEVEITEEGIYAPEATFTSTAVIWNNININWNSICSDWQTLGNGILNVESSNLLIDSTWFGSNATIDILITNNSRSFVALGQVNLGTGEVTFPSTTCNGLGITTDFAGTESQGMTIAYKHKAGTWGSKYSFKPSNYSHIGNKMYSFFHNENGLAWVHNKNETRNNFYGVQYPSVFEVCSNYNPSMIKTYSALGIEGGGTWTTEVSNQTQKTTIEYFDQREGHQYAEIRRDIVQSSGHKIFVGTIESVSGNEITFSTPINRLPFNIGDELKIVSGSNLVSTGSTITGISDRKTITCSSSVFNGGENIMVEQSSFVNGDPIRDVFAKIRMTSTDTEPFEVHALSTHYTRSKLHNDRVN